jgi:purine catabolism regulator
MPGSTDRRPGDGPPGGGLTVAELVSAPDLHLQVVAGHAGLSKVVEAVYIGDLDDPTPWMVQGSVVLTTGPRLEADPESGVRLVRLLKRSGMVGVGVAIQPNVRVIPAVMLQAGDDEDLPILRVPEETPFRLITSYVFNALVSRDMHRLRRSVAMQQCLVDALLDEHSVEALAGRLGELLGAQAVVFDRAGRVLASSSGSHPAPDERELVARAWREYDRLTRQGGPRSVFELDDHWVGFREVRVSGRLERLLLVVHPAGRLISELADASLSFAQRLLEVSLGTVHVTADARRRARSGLLELLLHERGGPSELAERLVNQGIEPGESWRLAVLGVGARPAAAVHAALDALLEERDAPFLSHRLGGEVFALCPAAIAGDDGAAAARFFGEVAETVGVRTDLGSLPVGVSAAATGVEQVRRAAGQARLALYHGDEAADGVGASAALDRPAAAVRPGEAPPTARSRPAPTVTLFEELGARYLALDALSTEVLTQLRAAVADRLRSTDARRGTELLDTLEAYLAHGGQIGETADVLFVHRNTLRKRLARIEQLLGVDLAASGGLVEVYLGLRAADVLAARELPDG